MLHLYQRLFKAMTCQSYLHYIHNVMVSQVLKPQQILKAHGKDMKGVVH